MPSAAAMPVTAAASSRWPAAVRRTSRVPLVKYAVRRSSAHSPPRSRSTTVSTRRRPRLSWNLIFSFGCSAASHPASTCNTPSATADDGDVGASAAVSHTDCRRRDHTEWIALRAQLCVPPARARRRRYAALDRQDPSAPSTAFLTPVVLGVNTGRYAAMWAGSCVRAIIRMQSIPASSRSARCCSRAEPPWASSTITRTLRRCGSGPQQRNRVLIEQLRTGL